MKRAWFTGPQWQELRAAVVTERAIWNEEGPIVAITGPGLKMDDRSLMEQMIPPEHLGTVRVLMAKSMDVAYRAGFALIDERQVN